MNKISIKSLPLVLILSVIFLVAFSLLENEEISKEKPRLSKEQNSLYQNKEYGFKFYYPTAWKIDESQTDLFHINLSSSNWLDEQKNYIEGEMPTKDGDTLYKKEVTVYESPTIVITIFLKSFYDTLNELYVEQIEGEWAIHGAKGSQEKGEEVSVDGQRTIKGTLLTGSYYEGGGYAGLEDSVVVVLSTPFDRYSIEFIAVAYNEVLDEILSSFKFTR